MRGEVRDGRGWARRIAARGRARGLPSRRSPARRAGSSRPGRKGGRRPRDCPHGGVPPASGERTRRDLCRA
ncbi:hypothetical protein EBESD8_23730 [Rhodococcus aetherivorans]|nr:hypothetical protein EBESD8_23730 [Rhodococcus aetherivorans]